MDEGRKRPTASPERFLFLQERGRDESIYEYSNIPKRALVHFPSTGITLTVVIFPSTRPVSGRFRLDCQWKEGHQGDEVSWSYLFTSGISRCGHAGLYTPPIAALVESAVISNTVAYSPWPTCNIPLMLLLARGRLAGWQQGSLLC
jgi:hypothetical protein